MKILIKLYLKFPLYYKISIKVLNRMLLIILMKTKFLLGTYSSFITKRKFQIYFNQNLHYMTGQNLLIKTYISHLSFVQFFTLAKAFKKQFSSKKL